jgi:hypothetical protein
VPVPAITTLFIMVPIISDRPVLPSLYVMMNRLLYPCRVGVKKNLGGIEKRSSLVLNDERKSHKSGPRLKTTHIPIAAISIQRVILDPFSSIELCLRD